jgi:hypothetical protein
MNFKKIDPERVQRIIVAIFLLVIMSIFLKTLQYFELCCMESSPPHGFNKRNFEHMENKRKQQVFDNFATEYIRKNL